MSASTLALVAQWRGGCKTLLPRVQKLLAETSMSPGPLVNDRLLFCGELLPQLLHVHGQTSSCLGALQRTVLNKAPKHTTPRTVLRHATGISLTSHGATLRGITPFRRLELLQAHKREVLGSIGPTGPMP